MRAFKSGCVVVARLIPPLPTEYESPSTSDTFMLSSVAGMLSGCFYRRRRFYFTACSVALFLITPVIIAVTELERGNHV